MKTRCLAGFAALLAQTIFVQATLAQINSNMQPLLEALHNQAFDNGRHDGVFTPTPQQMLQSLDAGTVQQLATASNALRQNPNNVTALVTRGIAALNAADRGLYSYFWVHFAAVDLERAIRLDPKNFFAEHDYGMACYQAGDFSDSQQNMRLAVLHLTRAIQLKPDSARSYMGRGWAYLMLDDSNHAQADFNKALEMDPSLRGQLTRVADEIRQKRAQKGCVQATLQRMGAYVVNRNARTPDQCSAARGAWINGECRISTAMAPGPLMTDPRDAGTANQGLGGANCAPPANAPDYRYSPRAGGYVVR